jgi:PAS domain S-box-containing protein
MQNKLSKSNTEKDLEILGLKLAAKRSENKLRSFFDSSSVIHLLIDTNLGIIDFNRAAQLFLLKYYKTELYYGMKATENMHSDHTAVFMQCYHKALLGIPSRVERVFTYGKEKIVWFLAYEPATDCDGKVIGMSFNAIDITEKVASEDKISSQYRSLNEIAHIHSHDLRRPVSNIIGLMSMFKSEGYTCTHEDLIMLEKAVTDLQIQVEGIEGLTK